VVGETINSVGFPDVGSWITPRGQSEAFIFRFEDETARVGGPYGGSATDIANDVAVDANGWAYVTGVTSSDNFPMVNAYQPARAGASDAFIMKIHPSGIIEHATYLGGTLGDDGMSIAILPQSGNGSSPAFVTGITSSSGFPTTPGSFQTTAPGPPNAFVTKMSFPGGSGVVDYSTFLGGGAYDLPQAIAVDRHGRAFVSGYTFKSTSPPFPTTNAVQPICGDRGTFLTKVAADGASLIYSTSVGCGSFSEARVAVDRSGNAYVTGALNGSPLLAHAIQSTGGGGTEAFIAKLTEAPSNFTDNDLTFGGLGIVVRLEHINELRVRIDAQRVRYGLSSYSWTDPTLDPESRPFARSIWSSCGARFTKRTSQR
jgi:hypothetical protein